METDITTSAPAVVAVMVAHDPGDWFDEALAGLAEQTYPDLAVLIIDAASAGDVVERIAATLPEAHVRRLEQNRGFGAAANAGVALVDGAAFYLLCHDDVALEADAVQQLVDEALRSNAGVVGPKLVDWHDPRRLLQVGSNIDKLGAVAPVGDRGELDQQQHDSVRDVFAVPGAATLIRSDLFDQLGGFDEAIDYLGDDLDLCWRCHVAGARVLVAPGARARHVEALGARRPADDRRRQAARSRLRSLLGCYSFLQLLVVLPQAFLSMLLEAAYGLFTGRLDQAADVASAWPWNARRLLSLLRRRRRLRRLRATPDRAIRQLQMRGSTRLRGFVRGWRDRGSNVRDRANRQVVWAVATVVLLLVIGSRNLVSGRLPVIGELAPLPSSPRYLLQSWVSGWRTAGLGSDAAAPTGFGVLGALGVVFFGAMGVLRKVLLVGMLPLGAIGAWRLARPIGSLRASAVAFAVYVAIPVPYNALARGSWSGLILYAASPWLFLGLARATRRAPFGEQGVTGGSGGRHALRRQILGLGIVLALVGTMVPFVLAVVVLMAAGLAVGSLVCLRSGGVPRMVATALSACVVAIVLHLPWSLEFLRTSGDWTAFAGPRAAVGGPLSLGRLLRFQSGPFGAPPLGWAFLVAAAMPLVVGRSWRLDWAVRAWFVALAGWALLWSGQEGWLTVGLPAPEILLAPVSVSLALAAGLGVAAFETDMRGRRFGWRRAVGVVGLVAVLAGALPLTSGLIDGRWKVPGHDFMPAYEQLLATKSAPFRVLWVGDPDVLPLAGWRLDEHLAYATTDHGAPDATNLWAGTATRATQLLADALRTATAGRTDRLGRLLAPMGVRYLMLPDRLAPPPFARDVRPLPARLLSTLGEQLDLEAVPVSGGVTVYRNRAWTPVRAVLPDTRAARTGFSDAVTEDLSGATPALREEPGPTTARGSIPAAGSLLVASASSPRWQLEMDGRQAPHSTLYGWANSFRVIPSSRASLTYRTPIARVLALAGQVLLWVITLVALALSRRRDRSAPGGAAS